MTKIYRLSDKIIAPAEIEKAISSFETVEVESVLEIAEGYYINRYANENIVAYVHFNGDKIFKICLYEKVSEEKDG